MEDAVQTSHCSHGHGSTMVLCSFSLGQNGIGPLGKPQASSIMPVWSKGSIFSMYPVWPMDDHGCRDLAPSNDPVTHGQHRLAEPAGNELNELLWKSISERACFGIAGSDGDAQLAQRTICHSMPVLQAYGRCCCTGLVISLCCMHTVLRMHH